MANKAKDWLKKIHALPLTETIKIMNVCGGHERTLSHAAIRTVLPEQIELIPGPGCPVCVCPEEDIYTAIQWALTEDVTVISFGDMLRVPVNCSKDKPRSLEQARAAGADVKAIASPLEAVSIAQQQDKPVIFFAVGFETTMAPIAAMLAQGVPDNLFVLLSGRLTWPAVSMLLESGTPGFNTLIAPGHVSTIMGADEWQFVTKDYNLPTAVAGFMPESLLAAIYSTTRQHIEGQCFLDNCYEEVVTAKGNANAQQLLQQCFKISDSNWRGIGVIKQSGYELQEDYQHLNARRHFKEITDRQDKRSGQMPPGCDCARVVLGQCYPHDCKLYGKACTPQTPIGPCMVSDEGACQIWWNTKTKLQTAR